jgi:hypothetical protein
MKKFILAVLLGWGALSAQAHDEGHGPKLTDQGQRGGVMAPVIDKKENKLGAKAAVVYKAELVRSEDGTVYVYLYDKEMHPLEISKIPGQAKGIIETEKKGKFTRVPFALQQEEEAVIGMAPKPAMKPFNIDVTWKEGDRELLVAFDNLD